MGLLDRFRRPAVRASIDNPPENVLGMYLAPDGSMRPVTTQGIKAGYSNGFLPFYGAYSELPINSTPQGYAFGYIASVWANRCVEIRSQIIGQMPHKVVSKRTGKAIGNHPLTIAIDRSAQDVLYRLEWSRLIWGETFLYPTQNAYGYHSDLYWLNNIGMSVVQGAGVIKALMYTPIEGGKPANFDPSQIAFLKTANPFSDLRGLSKFESVLLEVGIDKDIARTTKAFYANDTRVGLMLIPENDLAEPDAQRFTDYWRSNFQGPKNAGKPALLPKNIKDIKEIQRSPTIDDVELRESVRREICAAFGVPLSIAGAWDDAQYQSAPEQRKSLYEDTIMKECEMLAREINHKLMPFFDDSGNTSFEFDMSDILALMEDKVQKEAQLAQRLVSGGIMLNEYRLEVGKQPIPGGDVFFIPTSVSVTPMEKIGLPPVQQMPYSAPPTGVVVDMPIPPSGGAPALQAPQPPAIPTEQKQPAQLPATVQDKNFQQKVLQTSELDELEAWERKALNGGAAKAAKFQCYQLPAEVQMVIRHTLQHMPEGDKRAIRDLFAKTRVALESSEDVKKKLILGKATPLEGEITATPEETAAYWDAFDKLYAEIGSSWLNDYMRKALDKLRSVLRRSLAPDDIMHLLDGLRAELAAEWIGTEEQPGVITKLIQAGMAAGNHALEQGRASNPVKSVLTVDWALLNKQALEYAQSYTYDLISGLDATTQAEVQNALVSWVQTGAPLSDLEADLEVIFNDAARAELIAQTESTRTYNEGSKERWRQVGVKQARWQTVNDGEVCPTCRELHKQEFDIEQGAWSDVLGEYVQAPVHPGCRCFARPITPAVADLPADVQAQAPPQPKGASVSSSLSFDPKGLTQKLKTRLQSALDQIDKIHGVNKLPDIPIKISTGKKRVGGYAHSAMTNEAVEIRVSSKGNTPGYALSHEIGHFIDHKGLDPNTKYVWPSQQAKNGQGPLADWFKAVSQTPEYQKLLDIYKNPGQYTVKTDKYRITPDLQYIRYLLDPKEIWARSYAQYIAEKTGDEALLNDIQEERGMDAEVDWYTNAQWTSENFAPISQTIDDLMQSLGWVE